MKRIYLLRHAKSSWKDEDLADHDRPLAGRGRKAAKAIGRHLRAEAIAPELVLCSTALRVRQTLERIEPALSASAVHYEPELYAASAQTLLERVHRVPDEISSLMLIGHNPALEQLALELARPSIERRRLETKYPTGALALLESRGTSWRDLDRDHATLVLFVCPRDLQT